MEEEQPVYVVTETGLELQKKTPEAAPVEKSRYLLGSPFLTFALFLALTAYFLDAGEWMKAAERYVASKNRSAAAQPYRDWARLHPMDYDEVAAVPDIWTGIGTALIIAGSLFLARREARPGPARTPG